MRKKQKVERGLEQVIVSQNNLEIKERIFKYIDNQLLKNKFINQQKPSKFEKTSYEEENESYAIYFNSFPFCWMPHDEIL